MHHYVNAITNTKGDALIGYFVRCVDAATGVSATLYADASLTPILSVSGVANAAQVDSDGNVSFYIAAGTYHLDIYATDSSSFVRRIQNLPMVEEVNGGNVEINVMTVGAKCDAAANGSTGTDDTVAVQTAINAAAALGGGTIIIPAHTICTGPLDLASKQNIRIVGPSGAGSGYGNFPPAQLIYTGTGSRFIDGRSAVSCELSNLGIRYTSNSFTGDLIDFSHDGSGADACYNLVDRCIVGGISAHSARRCINLNDAIICTIRGNHFTCGVVGIGGTLESSPGYSNAHTIDDNTFDNFTTSAIINAGQAWAITKNRFEGTNDGTSGGMPRAYYDDFAVAQITLALSFRDNWCGDAVAVSDAWFNNHNSQIRGLTMSGNYISANAGVAGVKFGTYVLGGNISGNYISDHIDLAGLVHEGLSIHGNFMGATVANVPTTFAGTTDLMIFANSVGTGTPRSFIRLGYPDELRLGDGGVSGVLGVLKGLSEIDISGAQVLGSRYAGTPAAATDLPTTLTLLNFIRDALLNHHGAIGT